ncbi:ABC transporter ATP-binding protein [Oceanivirga miroungae]|uniref:Iron(III) ABC transporter, ATP-binding protein n=1 Tax=Oceanivirga miroungae TaxID=1130046 RepID=A0A6I8ME13_9FUSO|nr:ABC transporter ATP-binding protein [Oceanivirga miroungae]VWL85695.1 iron(III) ABC transporter, ATP-binding protein [Oceanivirga miroungae]
MNNEDMIEIKNLRTSFSINDKYYAAVDDVSLKVKKNEILAIVGESGCGKSTLATSIVGLHNPLKTKVEGEILFKGENIENLNEAEMNKIRGKKIGMIFQDPLSALNPLMRIGDQIEESLIYHTDYTKEERKEIILELIKKVGIPNPERIARRFPHELSGGMRQRVVIAIALSCKPDLLICDEPTTALDVTIQAQILDLIKELQKETGSAVILITHDLGVVAELADRVAVMYAGQIVEFASVDELFENPVHPYTRSLLSSIPQLDKNEEKLHVIQGTVPSIINLNRDGCRFASRIDWIDKNEHEENPTMHEVSTEHFVQCTCYKNFYFKDGEI